MNGLQKFVRLTPTQAYQDNNVLGIQVADYEHWLQYIEPAITGFIRHKLTHRVDGRDFGNPDGYGLKYQISIKAELHKNNHPQEFHIAANSATITVGSVINSSVAVSIAEIAKKISENFIHKSGCIFSHFIWIDISIAYFKLSVGAAASYIETPELLFNKKCIINPKNRDDNDCFRWCLMTYHFHDQYADQWPMRSNVITVQGGRESTQLELDRNQQRTRCIPQGHWQIRRTESRL